jgi:hypothetical protein
MAAFKCSPKIRLNRASASFVEYTYETSLDAAVLNRNLRVILDELGVPGQIQFGTNVLEVVRIGTR